VLSEISRVALESSALSPAEISQVLAESIDSHRSALQRVLLVPPDITRLHSGAGPITCTYYRMLSQSCHVDVLPALGTHQAMTGPEIDLMFPGIPHERFLHHDWRSELMHFGDIPAHWMESQSGGYQKTSVAVELNRAFQMQYDLIVSIGQVVPHEVAGMANYTKNVVVGCGGKQMIDGSHMLGAVYGIEQLLGIADNPVRALFDYAQSQYLSDLPILYVLSVSTGEGDRQKMHGLFVGTSRKTFEEAAALSQKMNVIDLPQRLSHVVVWLDPKKFKTTWLGNKAIYRTRMALADGAELTVLAPGIRRFGEDERFDALIRKYGYVGRKRVLELIDSNQDLKDNLSVAAHLIHGSSEGRFTITYATEHMAREEIEKVGFEYADYRQVKSDYRTEEWSEGFQRLSNGKEIYFIANPAAALWRA
jgi:nickel-dependent lactate racemase